MKAVLVIDMQKGALYPDKRPYGELTRQIAAINTVLHASYGFRMFIETAEKTGEGTIPEIKNGFCLPRFIKDKDDAFEEVGQLVQGKARRYCSLDVHLRNNAVDGIVLAGVNVECCLLKAARHALDLGYAVYSAEDLAGSNNVEYDDIGEIHNDKEVREALQWLKEHTTFFKSHTELIRSWTA